MSIQSPVIADVDLEPIRVDFQKAIDRVIVRDKVPHPKNIASEVTQFIAEDGFESKRARDLLAKTGVRAVWNERFADVRSRQVAEWIAPLFGPTDTVLDVLAGDCRLTKEIASRISPRVYATERVDHFDDIINEEGFEFLPWIDGSPLPDAGSMFFGAVLHHENDPSELVRLAAASSARRFVIVENCVDLSFSPDLHLALDLFFNQTLNDFGSDCVRQHRTAAEWTSYLSPLGELTHFDEMSGIAGLPFPYQVLVFDRA